VSAAWTVKDSKGDLLPSFVAHSAREVGRKVLGMRHDAFRLEVSRSYRELFDRDLESILNRREWRIVPLARGKMGRPKKQLELQLN
jgi:hypothetical protein